MKAFITNTFEFFLGVAFFIVVICGVVAGIPFGGVLGMIVGGILGFILASVLFGLMYVLIEIRDLLRQQSPMARQPSAVQPVVTAALAPPSHAHVTPAANMTPIAIPVQASGSAHCPHCGFSNAPGRTVCGYCGKPL